jgi:o-succinylbenzoate---CoA ligase
MRKTRLQTLYKKISLASHICITSSGSEKLVALSKQAFLVSAQSVNKHLQATPADTWGLALPLFHVGGLSIQARAFLTDSNVVDCGQWDAKRFGSQIKENKITLTSLVPTQVFDLVSAQIKCPPTLRALVVGGAKLDENLYQKAKDLGWPLLPSYGMTECCSQIATATIGDPRLKILSHLKVKIDAQGILSVSGSSLLTGYAFMKDSEASWVEPVADGWYRTSDRAEIEEGYLIPLGRQADFVKVNGEGVSLQKLRELLADETGELALVSLENSRSGAEIVLIHSQKISSSQAQALQNQFNQKVAPYERITAIICKAIIPKTAIGKIDYSKITR